jgi:hypothetical protein
MEPPLLAAMLIFLLSKLGFVLEWFYSVLTGLELPCFVLVYAKAEINILI